MLWQKSPAFNRPSQSGAARNAKDHIISVRLCKGLRHRAGHGRDEGERLISAFHFYFIKGVGVDAK